jgi:hypothetical protein
MQPDIVNALQQTLGQGGARLFDLLPVQLRNVLENKLWLQCTDKNRKLFTSFEAFVVHRLPQGLESTIADLEGYCHKKQHADVREMIRREAPAAQEHGGTGANRYRHNNVMSVEKQGNSPAYALRRLKRDRPDLAELVISGKLTTNAAAIKAGFRARTISVPIDTPEHALKPLIKIFGASTLAKALK